MTINTPTIDSMIDSDDDLTTLVMTHNVMLINVIDTSVEVWLSHPSGTHIIRHIPCVTHAQAHAVSAMLKSVWCNA